MTDDDKLTAAAEEWLMDALNPTNDSVAGFKAGARWARDEMGELNKAMKLFFDANDKYTTLSERAEKLVEALRKVEEHEDHFGDASVWQIATDALKEWEKA